MITIRDYSPEKKRLYSETEFRSCAHASTATSMKAVIEIWPVTQGENSVQPGNHLQKRKEEKEKTLAFFLVSNNFRAADPDILALLFPIFYQAN